jgi:hypothetical protein
MGNIRRWEYALFLRRSLKECTDSAFGSLKNEMIVLNLKRQNGKSEKDVRARGLGPKQAAAAILYNENTFLFLTHVMGKTMRCQKILEK